MKNERGSLNHSGVGRKPRQRPGGSHQSCLILETFSTSTKDYDINLAFAIMGTIIHMGIAVLLIIGRREAIEELRRRRFGSKLQSKEIVYVKGRITNPRHPTTNV